MKKTGKTKNYKGFTFKFTPENGRGYKVKALGFVQYWYQSTMSVRKALKMML